MPLNILFDREKVHQYATCLFEERPVEGVRTTDDAIMLAIACAAIASSNGLDAPDLPEGTKDERDIAHVTAAIRLLGEFGAMAARRPEFMWPVVRVVVDLEGGGPCFQSTPVEREMPRRRRG